MPGFRNVLKTSDLSDGAKKTVTVSGKRIAVFNVGGEFFAVDDMCTHQQCSLGTNGFSDGREVICGCHGARFDVTTGKALSLPATIDLVTYKTKVEGDNILIYV